MGRSQESFSKKEVRNKKEKKRKEKAKKRLAKRDEDKKSSLDDMIAYVDEFGNISDTPPDPDDKEEVKAEDVQIGAANQNSGKEDYDPIRTGRVTFFNHTKGFGFIQDQETKESVFVHINNSKDELVEGNLVNFEVEMGPKGPAANNVKLIK